MSFCSATRSWLRRSSVPDETPPSVQATVPPLFAVLLGGNEVSSSGEANAGDPDGYGSATVIIRGTTLCFGITVDGIDKPILAHIHQAPAGLNGDIVVESRLRRRTAIQGRRAAVFAGSTRSCWRTSNATQPAFTSTSTPRTSPPVPFAVSFSSPVSAPVAISCSAFSSQARA